MKNLTAPATWSIPDALAVAYAAFAQRFGADLLWQAFEALTIQPDQTQKDHKMLAHELDQFLGAALNAKGERLVTWLATAKSKPDNKEMLLHCAVRWWLARDDLMRMPSDVRVPCVYAVGSKDHHSLQLLAQMLYRGSAPDTTPPQVDPVQKTRA